MKKMLTVVCSMILAVGLVSVANAKMKAPEADAQQLYDYITKQKTYVKWKLWPGKGKLYKGAEPHGALLTTYVNDTALKSIKAKKGLKDGSIIVKENYMPDKKLAAVTVMYKVKGYNSEAGDLFWLKYLPDGKIEASGKVGMCIGCHSNVKANDYLFTGKVK
jgi:hypothetical protein